VPVFRNLSPFPFPDPPLLDPLPLCVACAPPPTSHRRRLLPSPWRGASHLLPSRCRCRAFRPRRRLRLRPRCRHPRAPLASPPPPPAPPLPPAGFGPPPTTPRPDREAPALLKPHHAWPWPPPAPEYLEVREKQYDELMRRILPPKHQHSKI
ncbi:hypothetical protein BRADI_4g11557v3, partial [Brachypodium distachyon]